MPKEIEFKLKREARKKGLAGKELEAYIYGTMQKIKKSTKRKIKKK